MKEKKEQGITLVALVVTIIIMIILAGVSIKILTDSGLIGNALESRKTYEIAQYKDAIDVAVARTHANDLREQKTAEKLLDEIWDRLKDTKLFQGSKSKKSDSKDILYITTKEGYGFEVKEESITQIGMVEGIPEIQEGDIVISGKPEEWTNQNVKVKIEIANESYQKNYQIEYMIGTGETTPLESGEWKTYLGEFEVEENTKIYARLANKMLSGNKCTQKEINNIDKIKPVIKGIAATTNGVTINATDEASGIVGYAVTQNNIIPNEFTGCANTTNLSTAIDGLTHNTTYYVWVKDEAGNVSETKEITTKEITKLTLTANPTSWTNRDVSIRVEAKNNNYSKICYTTDGTTPTVETQTTVKNGESFTVDRNANVYVTAYDSAGQAGETASYTVSNIDKESPTTPNISNPTNGKWTNQMFVLTVDSTDINSGVDTIQYSYNKTNWLTDWGNEYITSGNKKTIKGTWSAERNQEIFVRAIDKAGNISETSSSYIKIDKTKPIVTEATATTNSINIKATDEASGIVGYAVTTSKTAPTSFTACTNTKSLNTTVSGKTQGTKYYTWVKDEAGNVSLGKEVSTIVVSGITMVPTTTSWTNENIGVKITAQSSNYSKICYTTNGTTPTSSGSTIKSGESIVISSNCTIKAIAYDNTNQAGATASLTISNIDKEKPKIVEYELEAPVVTIEHLGSYTSGTSWNVKCSVGNCKYLSNTGWVDVDGSIALNYNQGLSFMVQTKDDMIWYGTFGYVNGSGSAGTCKLTNKEPTRMDYSTGMLYWDSSGSKGSSVAGSEATTSSITFEARDYESGIVGYAITTSNTQPSSFTSCSNTSYFRKTITGLNQNTKYYIWVKDAAGNVSSNSGRTLKVADLEIRSSRASDQSVTVTITAKNENYKTIRYNIGTSPTLSSRGTTIANGGSFKLSNDKNTVYAIAYDSAGQAGATASLTISHIHTNACYSTTCKGTFATSTTSQNYYTCTHVHTHAGTALSNNVWRLDQGQTNLDKTYYSTSSGCYTNERTLYCWNYAGGIVDWSESKQDVIPTVTGSSLTVKKAGAEEENSKCHNCKKTFKTIYNYEIKGKCGKCGKTKEFLTYYYYCSDKCLKKYAIDHDLDYVYCSGTTKGYSLSCTKGEGTLYFARNVTTYSCATCGASATYYPYSNQYCSICHTYHTVNASGTTSPSHNAVTKYLICGK